MRQNENDESGFAGWVKSVRNGKLKMRGGYGWGLVYVGVCLFASAKEKARSAV